MKECADFHIIPLTYFINLSISQGHFPSELKLAKLIPIYKSGDKQIIENYRPISVLPFFSNYVLNFLDEHSILYAHQYGFRRGHSTSHAIISLVEKVSHSLDTGKIVVGVFSRFEKSI